MDLKSESTFHFSAVRMLYNKINILVDYKYNGGFESFSSNTNVKRNISTAHFR